MLFGFPLVTVSASAFSTLFTRQLVVPSLSESAVMGTTDFVGILPVPTIQSDFVTGLPFAMAHGPVVASVTSTLDHPWTVGHGLAMSSPTVASSRTTVHGAVVPDAPNYCGECYGAPVPTNLKTAGCCNTCDEIRDAYASVSWSLSRGEGVEQCEREDFAEQPTSSMSPLQVVTKAAPPPASTLATVIKRSPAALNTSRVARRPLITPSQINDLLGCHPEDDNWIYFTLMKSDDSIALSLKWECFLYFVSKEWALTYPDKIRKALFNDPSSYSTCPEGHCRSTLIPGTDLRLSLVKSPKVFRSGRYEASCGYVDDVHTIRRNLITRAKFGYLKNGVTVADQIIPFVESQVLTTYPALEIGLIVGFTVGFFVIFPLVMLFFVCLYYCVNDSMMIVCEKMKQCGQALRQRIGEKRGNVDSSSQLPDPLPHQDRGYAAVPPPAYSFV